MMMKVIATSESTRFFDTDLKDGAEHVTKRRKHCLVSILMG